jgi:broad specificity phosphatase PhoE
MAIIAPHHIPDLVFFSSDFTRAYETAVICTKELQMMMLSGLNYHVVVDDDDDHDDIGIDDGDGNDDVDDIIVIR